MTLPQRRRTDRLRGRARLALAGDFPDDGKTFPELLRDVQPGDWNAAPAFSGASGAGLPDGAVYEPAPPAPALPRPPAPPPAFTPHDPRDTAPQQRLPRMTRVQQRPRPQRAPDAAIFLWSHLLSQHIMLCGVCPPERRSRHADPIAARMPFTFEALRQSAYVMGWRLDAFTRWACPACQGTTRYRAPHGVIHYDIQAAEAYIAGDMRGEFWHRAGAEHDLIRDVRDGVGNGKHRAGAR